MPRKVISFREIDGQRSVYQTLPSNRRKNQEPTHIINAKELDAIGNCRRHELSEVYGIVEKTETGYRVSPVQGVSERERILKRILG